MIDECFCTSLSAELQAAAAKGDYTAKPRQRVSYQYAYSMWIGMEQAAITCVEAASCCSLCFAD